jgi:hypothetical protein
MSLTSILSGKDNQELRDKFKTEFLRPEFKIQAELKAPPLTTNYTVVGTAFDYLLRFYLQRINKDKFEERGNWVADSAFKTLTDFILSRKGNEIATGFRQDKIYKTKDLLKIITDQYNQTKSNYSKFLKDGIVSDELVANTLYLAKLDVYLRAGIIDQNFDFHHPDDIKDIKAMLSLIDNEKFTAKTKCYFNPTFGAGSAIVGGADADLIIDNTLIDIKATKNLKLDRDHLNQTLGYYILSLIGGVNLKPYTRPIENIGIYYARHGELWTVPISSFGDSHKFSNFKDWFIPYVKPKEKTLKEWYEVIDDFIQMAIRLDTKKSEPTEEKPKKKVATKKPTKKVAMKKSTPIKKETAAKTKPTKRKTK